MNENLAPSWSRSGQSLEKAGELGMRATKDSRGKTMDG